MTRIELAKQLRAAALDYQQQAAHDPQGEVWGMTEDAWRQRVAHWERRILELEVGYAGGCPNSIRHPEPPQETPMTNLADQIAEARRELLLRRKVYPRWVEAGKLSAAKADQQFAAMSAILDTLMELERRSPALSPQRSLFDEA